MSVITLTDGRDGVQRIPRILRAATELPAGAKHLPVGRLLSERRNFKESEFLVQTEKTRPLQSGLVF